MLPLCSVKGSSQLPARICPNCALDHPLWFYSLPPRFTTVLSRVFGRLASTFLLYLVCSLLPVTWLKRSMFSLHLFSSPPLSLPSSWVCFLPWRTTWRTHGAFSSLVSPSLANCCSSECLFYTGGAHSSNSGFDLSTCSWTQMLTRTPWLAACCYLVSDTKEYQGLNTKVAVWMNPSASS